MTTQKQLNKTTFPNLLQNWITLFLLTVFSYSFYITEFLWGNHDWGWIKDNTPLLSGVFEGRFSQFILQNALTDGYILPIITLILAFGFYSLAIILLLNLLNLNKSTFLTILLGLFITTSPYTISWLYFAFITLSCLSWPFFAILAFYLLNFTPKFPHKLLYIALSSFLFLLCIGGYPPIINTIFSLFFIFILNNLILNHYTLKTTIQKALPSAIAIITSLALFLIIQYFLKKYNLQYDTYNTASLSLDSIFQNLLSTISLSLKQFINTTTFIGFNYKYLTLCLSLTALFILFLNVPKQLTHLIIFPLLTLALTLSSSLTSLLAENSNYVTFEPRIEFFGILYIYLFSFVVLLKSNNTFIKNLSFASLIYLIFLNINTISYSAKIWSLGKDSETLLINRIINDIESKPNFSPNRKYTFVQGGTLNFRERFYITPPNETVDSYTLSAPYIPWHLPSKAYKFYSPTDFFGKDFDIYWSYVPKHEIPQSQELHNYIQNKATAWPHKNAIFLHQDLIILTLTNDGLWRAQNWLNTQN